MQEYVKLQLKEEAMMDEAIASAELANSSIQEYKKRGICEICGHEICPKCHECHNTECDTFCESVKICWSLLSNLKSKK
jgi:lipoate synthase